MTTVRATVEIDVAPAIAFDLMVEELVAALALLQIRLEPRLTGRVVEGGATVGRVIGWEAGRRMLLEWHQADWVPDEVTEVEIRVEPIGSGTLVVVEHRGWGALLGDRGTELTGWFAGEVAAPLLRATAPMGFGDWLTDRRVRRPSGMDARTLYQDPIYHRPNFRAMLQELALTPDDTLLEVGCGGGAFLKEALRSGCRAKAIDHSADMVTLARAVNRESVAEGRLEVTEASADALPFLDATFTAVAMTGVFSFLSNPVAALQEVRRVLVYSGKLILFTGSPELRGTLAAPEPIARRLYFYEDEALLDLAAEAGFVEARVDRPDLREFALECGVPEEHLPLFSERSGQLLIAHKG